MIIKEPFFTGILVLLLSFTLMNCSSTREEKTAKMLSEIPPGNARIVGTISRIEPVSNSSNLKNPCSKVPCIALVKVTSADYGAGFPVLTMGEEIRIEFLFTLEQTSKELFPNMKESYPGLKEGQEFTALVSHIETINETTPSYQVYGYTSK